MRLSTRIFGLGLLAMAFYVQPAALRLLLLPTMCIRMPRQAILRELRIICAEDTVLTQSVPMAIRRYVCR